MAFIVLMVHVFIVALTFVDIDASHKYHDFSGGQGWCLFAVKTILFFYFYYCCSESKSASKKCKSQLAYLESLLLIGSAYLLAVPVTILTTFLFEPYERQYMYTLLSQITIFSASLAMFYMLSSSKSSYRKTNLDEAGLPQH